MVQVGNPLWLLGAPLTFEVELTVTDGFQAIDLFEIVKKGQVIAVTPPPVAGNARANVRGPVCSPAEPMTCVEDPSVQSLSALFPAGSTIALTILVKQFGTPLDGTAFSTLTGALAAYRRRR